jgi:hypothetical protein
MLVATCSKRRVISTRASGPSCAFSASKADAARSLRGILTVSSPSHSLRRGPSNLPKLNLSSIAKPLQALRYARRRDLAYCSIALQEAFSEVMSGFTEISFSIA